MPDQSRHRSPRSGRHPGVPGYKSPEKSLDYFREREVRQQAQREEDLDFLRDLLSH